MAAWQPRIGNLYDELMYEKACDEAMMEDTNPDGDRVMFLDARNYAGWTTDQKMKHARLIATNPLAANRIMLSPWIVVLVIGGKVTVGDYDTERRARRNYDQMCSTYGCEGYIGGYRAMAELEVRTS